jgi:acyl phosphate:glycerol-3-phosphate acyltransferase
MEIIITVLFSYVCGSIPYGLIITKIYIKKDIREIGSGNIGATNVLRTGNKYLAALTLILDVVKGYVPVILTKYYFPELVELSCISAFLGHLFPVWLKFKGGKGVATYLGIITALSIQLSLLFIFTWIILSLIFRYSSLSSMFGALTVFVINLMRETFLKADIASNSTLSVPNTTILFIFFILIIFSHRKNILNLKNKTELKIKI